MDAHADADAGADADAQRTVLAFKTYAQLTESLTRCKEERQSLQTEEAELKAYVDAQSSISQQFNKQMHALTFGVPFGRMATIEERLRELNADYTRIQIAIQKVKRFLSNQPLLLVSSTADIELAHILQDHHNFVGKVRVVEEISGNTVRCLPPHDHPLTIKNYTIASHEVLSNYVDVLTFGNSKQCTYPLGVGIGTIGSVT